MTHININLLCTIPGIDRRSAITIISEIGTDMSQFGSSKRLCCWAGLTPGNNESAGKKKSVQISRAGVYPKPALAQVVHAAVTQGVGVDCLYYVSERPTRRRPVGRLPTKMISSYRDYVSENSKHSPSSGINTRPSLPCFLRKSRSPARLTVA